MPDFLAFRGPDGPRQWVTPGADRPGPVGVGHALLITTYESAQEQQPASFDAQVWNVADTRVDGRPDAVRLEQSIAVAGLHTLSLQYHERMALALLLSLSLVAGNTQRFMESMTEFAPDWP